MAEKGFITIHIPKRVVDEARRRGLDVESIVINSILEKLRLDPDEEITIHIELTEKFLDEARKYINLGNLVQASEKPCKVAEECVKALAIKLEVPEAEEAKREGRWWTRLLSRAAKKLSVRLSEPVISQGWSVGYDLHVWGFHKAALDIDSVKATLPTIEHMLVKTKEIIQKQT